MACDTRDAVCYYPIQLPPNVHDDTKHDDDDIPAAQSLSNERTPVVNTATKTRTPANRKRKVFTRLCVTGTVIAAAVGVVLAFIIIGSPVAPTVNNKVASSSSNRDVSAIMSSSSPQGGQLEAASAHPTRNAEDDDDNAVPLLQQICSSIGDNDHHDHAKSQEGPPTTSPLPPAILVRGGAEGATQYTEWAQTTFCAAEDRPYHLVLVVPSSSSSSDSAASFISSSSVSSNTPTRRTPKGSSSQRQQRQRYRPHTEQVQRLLSEAPIGGLVSSAYVTVVAQWRRSKNKYSESPRQEVEEDEGPSTARNSTANANATTAHLNDDDVYYRYAVLFYFSASQSPRLIVKGTSIRIKTGLGGLKREYDADRPLQRIRDDIRRRHQSIDDEVNHWNDGEGQPGGGGTPPPPSPIASYLAVLTLRRPSADTVLMVPPSYQFGAHNMRGLCYLDTVINNASEATAVYPLVETEETTKGGGGRALGEGGRRRDHVGFIASTFAESDDESSGKVSLSDDDAEEEEVLEGEAARHDERSKSNHRTAQRLRSVSSSVTIVASCRAPFTLINPSVRSPSSSSSSRPPFAIDGRHVSRGGDMFMRGALWWLDMKKKRKRNALKEKGISAPHSPRGGDGDRPQHHDDDHHDDNATFYYIPYLGGGVHSDVFLLSPHPSRGGGGKGERRRRGRGPTNQQRLEVLPLLKGDDYDKVGIRPHHHLPPSPSNLHHQHSSSSPSSVASYMPCFIDLNSLDAPRNSFAVILRTIRATAWMATTRMGRRGMRGRRDDDGDSLTISGRSDLIIATNINASLFMKLMMEEAAALVMDAASAYNWGDDDSTSTTSGRSPSPEEFIRNVIYPRHLGGELVIVTFHHPMLTTTTTVSENNNQKKRRENSNGEKEAKREVGAGWLALAGYAHLPLIAQLGFYDTVRYTEDDVFLSSQQYHDVYRRLLPALEARDQHFNFVRYEAKWEDLLLVDGPPEDGAAAGTNTNMTTYSNRGEDDDDHNNDKGRRKRKIRRRSKLDGFDIHATVRAAGTPSSSGISLLSTTKAPPPPPPTHIDPLPQHYILSDAAGAAGMVGTLWPIGGSTTNDDDDKYSVSGGGSSSEGIGGEAPPHPYHHQLGGGGNLLTTQRLVETRRAFAVRISNAVVRSAAGEEGGGIASASPPPRPPHINVSVVVIDSVDRCIGGRSATVALSLSEGGEGHATRQSNADDDECIILAPTSHFGFKQRRLYIPMVMLPTSRWLRHFYGDYSPKDDDERPSSSSSSRSAARRGTESSSPFFSFANRRFPWNRPLSPASTYREDFAYFGWSPLNTYTNGGVMRVQQYDSGGNQPKGSSSSSPSDTYSSFLSSSSSAAVIRRSTARYVIHPLTAVNHGMNALANGGGKRRKTRSSAEDEKGSDGSEDSRGVVRDDTATLAPRPFFIPI